MPLNSITGESIYASENNYLNPNTILTKQFICHNTIYPNSMVITWNGLVVPFTAYKIENNTCIFPQDFPFALADEIICNYTIGE